MLRFYLFFVLTLFSFFSVANEFKGFNKTGHCDSLPVSLFHDRIVRIKVKPPYEGATARIIGSGFLLSGGVVSVREILTQQRNSKGYPEFKVETSDFTVDVTFAESLTRDFSMFYHDVNLADLKYPIVTLPVEGETVVVLGFRKERNEVWQTRGRVTEVVSGRMRFESEGGSELFGSAVYNCYGHLVGMVYDGEYLGRNNFPVQVEAFTFETLRRVWPFVTRPQSDPDYIGIQ